MLRTLLKSKIHRATVTEANLNYEGSVTIDRELMLAAGLVEFEQVQIYDVTNGNRLTTYAIHGEAGSGVICINGAAAHLVHPGDLIILCAYGQFDENSLAGFRPRVVHVDGNNRQR
jgi:aspartate 1-decarboxylase